MNVAALLLLATGCREVAVTAGARHLAAPRRPPAPSTPPPPAAPAGAATRAWASSSFAAAHAQAQPDAPASDAQEANAEPASELAAQMTAEHNRARAEVQADVPLPPLAWSSELAASARRWAAHLARRCEGLQHPPEATHGQNLAARTSRNAPAPFSAAEAVEGWVAEAKCWHPGGIGKTDACDASCVLELNSTGCGHYTQIVWRSTTELGCGYSSCSRDGALVEYWVCDYFPPGNVQGREPH